MLVQGCDCDAIPNRVRRQFLAGTRASKLKENTGTIAKSCILLLKFLIVPDTNVLTVNIGTYNN